MHLIQIRTILSYVHPIHNYTSVFLNESLAESRPMMSRALWRSTASIQTAKKAGKSRRQQTMARWWRPAHECCMCIYKREKRESLSSNKRAHQRALLYGRKLSGEMDTCLAVCVAKFKGVRILRLFEILIDGHSEGLRVGSVAFECGWYSGWICA